jgi:lipopolysaccharide heptosyltransferase II
VFSHLQLNDRRERLIVGLADAGLALVAPLLTRPTGRRDAASPRILLLRLERVGDLLMTLEALRAVRTHAPAATIDLVVGSWNEALARLIPFVDSVETLDVPWLARDSSGHGVTTLLRHAWSWRTRRYSLAINFEGDIRSQLLLGLSGAPRRVGFDMAGGGPMLTDRVRYDATRHTRDNVLHLVERAFALPSESLAGLPLPDWTEPALRLPAAERQRTDSVFASMARPLVAMHVSGGREIKQWDLERFADVGNRLAASHGATIVFTGIEADRPLVDAVRHRLQREVPVVDLAGQVDLVTLATTLLEVDLLLTADTGPMHLAAALGVPTVAIFGPSDPARWGPLSARARVVRASLPCSPCNRIRVPPERCRGHVPDCLGAVDADRVYQAAVDVLSGGRRGGRVGAESR